MGRFYGTRNANGRPKGAPNQATAKARELFTKLLDDNLERLQSDLDILAPKDRVKAILEIANYVLPKLRTIDVNEISSDEENDYFRPVIINLGSGKAPDDEAV